MKFFFVFILFFCADVFAEAASTSPIDIVFDIDWTTFYNIDPSEANQVDDQVISVENHSYRATDHMAQILETLSKHPNVRISFFSGGSHSRNLALLKSIQLSDGRTAYDVAYRVLSFENLIRISDDKSLKFTERYKKDFEGFLENASASRTILIDDQVLFAKAPWKAVFSLGRTTYQNKFDPTKSSQEYYPKDTAEWLADRDKALMWLYLLEEAIAESKTSKKPFTEIILNLWKAKSPSVLCKNAFAF